MPSLPAYLFDDPTARQHFHQSIELTHLDADCVGYQGQASPQLQTSHPLKIALAYEVFEQIGQTHVLPCQPTNALLAKPPEYPSAMGSRSTETSQHPSHVSCLPSDQATLQDLIKKTDR